MTLGKRASEIAPAALPDFEPFHVVAYAELDESPTSPRGVCAWPDCSADFLPSRPDQKYCCAVCRKKDEQELRRIGQKVAPALLAHQLGRYPKGDPALHELGTTARRYISHVQSGWVRNRRERIERARAQYE